MYSLPYSYYVMYVCNMYVNIEIVFLDFLKNDFLNLRGLWFERQYKMLNDNIGTLLEIDEHWRGFTLIN